MTVFAIDPLRDTRWSDLVDRHPHASVFHTTWWLEALQRTYGYRPTAFTTTPPGTALEDGIVCCEVRSWLTGRRLVSLPFSDHCEPLVQSAEARRALTTHLELVCRNGDWDYVELRPRTDRFTPESGVATGDRFWLHVLDLRTAEHDLFSAFHKDSVQRKIRRAERERLVYDEGRSEQLLREFYDVLLMTRRRHQVPPQPLAWFRNLIDTFGSSLKIRVARHQGRPIAAIVTLLHGRVMVYKYGGSDEAFHPLGSMHLLFWRAIQDGRASGCTWLDFGRSDLDNPGLATFKDRWGAVRSEITYQRYAVKRVSQTAFRKYAVEGVKQVLGHAPVVCRVAAGRILYRHAG